MSTSVVLHASPLAEVARLEPAAWREDLVTRLGAGQRAVTLYGTPAGDEVLVTAVLEEGPRRLHVSRTSLVPQVGYHELTSKFPALHCFERELHEQHGVRVAGHPWLKPIRFERGDQAAMNAYPFYQLDGKEVHEVAVGPIHAGVIEPGSFRFMCLGEHVHHLEIHLGYQHRGVEARLLRGDPRRLTPLVETIAGDSSVAHASAHCAAVERLASLASSLETEAARGVLLELERIAMHLAGLAGLAADVGFLQGATTYGRLRTTAINASMRLCGSRFGRGAVRPGGNPMTLDRPAREDLRRALALLAADLPIINDCFLAARTVQHRLQGVGVLSSEIVRELGLVGMAARASGVPLDQRSPGGGIYDCVPMAPRVEPSGDCWARARLRVTEIDASLRWLGEVIEAFPEWRAGREAPGPLLPSHLVIAVAEGWRGEVVHCLETDEGGALRHYKVQDPSLRNWMGLAIAVRGNEISDFPICNKSFDLSYCGNDL
jgi:Ni,Fe-hydrogenase III large subunit